MLHVSTDFYFHSFAKSQHALTALTVGWISEVYWWTKCYSLWKWWGL